MMRSAADFDTPNSGASCRIVRFVRQYAATSRAIQDGSDAVITPATPRSSQAG